MESAPAAPARRWILRQRWSRLLFAHWPYRPEVVQQRLPAGLTVDTFDGWAWLGVVPFLMDQVAVHTWGEQGMGIPGARAFPELNLRTYVRDARGSRGVYFFSLDAGSLLGVIGARVGFGLPYFWASMRMNEEPDGFVTYHSRRLAGGRVRFHARYRSLPTPSPQDDLRHFLTERYSLHLRRWGGVQRGIIQHAPWVLQQAEAELMHNDLPGSFGFAVPDRPPLLHYAPEVHMRAWLPRRVVS